MWVNVLLIKYFRQVYRLVHYLLSICIVSDVRDTEVKCILLQEERQSSMMVQRLLLVRTVSGGQRNQHLIHDPSDRKFRAMTQNSWCEIG